MNDRGYYPQRSRNGTRAIKGVDDLACGSHAGNIALSASRCKVPVALLDIENESEVAQTLPMLSSWELLGLLAERKIKRNAIAQVLNIDPAGVTRLYDGKRSLTLDEAKKLCEAFGLDGSGMAPLSVPVARLVAMYVAGKVDAPLPPEDPRLEDIARDLRAFSMFAADPQVRESIQAVQGFFQGLRLSQGRASEA